MLFEFKGWNNGELVEMAINDEAIAWVRAEPHGKTAIAFSGKEAEIIFVEMPYSEVLVILKGDF